MSKTATANNTLQRYETLKQAAERTGFTERTLRRRIEDGFLIAPLGTADCPEVETLRSSLLAVSRPSTEPRRAVRSRLPA